jgi:PKD repeat protein
MKIKITLSATIMCMTLMLSAQTGEFTVTVWKTPQGMPSGAGNVNPPITSDSLRSLLRNFIDGTPIKPHSLALREDTNIPFFELRKNPDRDRYQLRYNPRQAYWAVRGQGDERIIPLWTLLQAILRASQNPPDDPSDDNFTLWAGRYMAFFDIRYDLLESKLSGDPLRQYKEAALTGYRAQRPGPVANFTMSPANCTAPCSVSLRSTSENTNAQTTYRWIIDGYSELICKNPVCETQPLQRGSHTFMLIVENIDGQKDTFRTTFDIAALQPAQPQPQPYPQPVQPAPPQTPEVADGPAKPERSTPRTRNYNWQPEYALSLEMSLPAGSYRQTAEYRTNVSGWQNSSAGMARTGGTISFSLGTRMIRRYPKNNWLRQTKLRLGMQLGYLYNPYNKQTLDEQLQSYEQDLQERLAERTITAPGHHFPYAGLYIGRPIKKNTAFEIAGGYLWKFTLTDVTINYYKEDNSNHTSLLTYGQRWNRTPYLSGRLWLSFGGEQTFFMSIAYMHANINFPRRTYSFGSESALLRLDRLPIRTVNLGLVYRFPHRS